MTDLKRDMLDRIGHGMVNWGSFENIASRIRMTYINEHQDFFFSPRFLQPIFILQTCHRHVKRGVHNPSQEDGAFYNRCLYNRCSKTDRESCTKLNWSVCVHADVVQNQKTIYM